MQAVAVAESKLKDTPLGEKSSVRDAWANAKWEEVKHQGCAVSVVYDSASDKMLTYPSLASSPTAVSDVLEAFAQKLEINFGEESRQKWGRKLVLPRADAILEFSIRMKKAVDYKGVVMSFSTAVDRLIAVHLANALIANSVPIAEAVNLNIVEWGATAKFATLQTPYSLAPLIGAYCPQFVTFPAALCSYVTNQFSVVYESSLAREMRRLVESLF